MMRLLALALWLAPAARAAVVVPPVETPLPPAAVAAAASAPVHDAPPITAELLDRWEIPVERYLALDAAAKIQLRGDLAIGERARVRRLELLQSLRPQQWRGLVTTKGFLTTEGLAVIAEHEAALRARGLRVPAGIVVERKDGKPLGAEDLVAVRQVLDRTFDGVSSLDPKAASAGTELVIDARVRNETVHSMTITDPNKGLVLEVGQLGIDGRTPILAPSPYVNLTKSWNSKAESWVDYRVKAQIGYVDMKARFFSTGPDPRVQRMLDLANSMGAGGTELDKIRGHLTYDDAYRAQGLVIASLLAQVGRAYKIAGPVDIAWSVTSLTKIFHLAPNQAFDESLGLRIKLPGQDLVMAVMGGVTQNISPVGNHLYQELMAANTVKPGFNIENAPHWTVALWGRVPGLDNARFSISGGQRYNKDTTVTQGEAALLTSFRRVPIAVRAQISRERGDEIGFDREKARLQVEAQIANGVTGYIGAERDRFQFGNAEVKSNSIVAGVVIDLDRNRNGSRITVDHVFGPEYKDGSSPLRPYLPDATRAMTRTLADGLDAASAAADVARMIDSGAAQAQIDSGLNALSLALVRLAPEARSALLDRLAALDLSEDQRRILTDAFTRVAPSGNPNYADIRGALAQALGPSVDQWLARLRDEAGARAELLDLIRAKARDAAELMRLLADDESWRAVAVSAGRAALLQGLVKDQVIDIPVLDKQITLKTNAPVILAAVGAINSRLSPLAPVKIEQAEPWLLRMAGDQLGLPAGPVTSEMIASQLITMGQARIQQEIDGRLTPAVNQLIASGVYDRTQIANQVFGALPSAAADALRARYGASLEGLLPPEGATADQIRQFVSQRLGAEIGAYLRAELQDQAAAAMAQMISWAAELLTREINLATIHWILAAEELDRLTVDRGRKAGDLGVEMIMRSFEKLDERKRDRAARSLHRAKAEAIDDFVADEKLLAGRLTELGKKTLEAKILDPNWPQGFAVVVPEEAWAPLISNYGDSAFFDFVDKLAERRRATGKTGPLVVTIEYDPHPHSLGTVITNKKDGNRGFKLGRAKDRREAEFRLQNLDSYLK